MQLTFFLLEKAYLPSEKMKIYFCLFPPYIEEIILVSHFTFKKKYILMQRDLENSYKQKKKKLKLLMLSVCRF